MRRNLCITIYLFPYFGKMGMRAGNKGMCGGMVRTKLHSRFFPIFFKVAEWNFRLLLFYKVARPHQIVQDTRGPNPRSTRPPHHPPPQTHQQRKNPSLPPHRCAHRRRTASAMAMAYIMVTIQPPIPPFPPGLQRQGNRMGYLQCFFWAGARRRRRG